MKFTLPRWNLFLGSTALLLAATSSAIAAGRNADGGCTGMETFKVRTTADETLCRSFDGIFVDRPQGNKIPKCENEQREKMPAKCCCHGG